MQTGQCVPLELLLLAARECGQSGRRVASAGTDRIIRQSERRGDGDL